MNEKEKGKYEKDFEKIIIINPIYGFRSRSFRNNNICMVHN